MAHQTIRLCGSACAAAMSLAIAAAARADGSATQALPSDAPSAQLAEIVVTAEKREENVQSAPLSISVVEGRQLVQRGVISLFDTGPLVAGMVFSRAPDDGLGLTFRGLGTPARNQSFDQSIALFIDGAFVGKGRLYGANLFDVDRTEFIKSTESTLLGKNTDLGAISVVTRKPGDTFAANASIGARLDHGGYIFDGGVDLPISDKLSIRIAGHANDTNGYVRNAYNGGEYPKNQDYGLRATAIFRPTEHADFSLSYQYTFDHSIGNPFQYVDSQGVLPPSFGEGVLDDHQFIFTSIGQEGQSFHSLEADIVNLTGNIDVGNFKVTTISSYMKYNMLFLDDFDFGPKDGNDLVRTEHYWQGSQEVRVSSPVEQPISFLAGASAFYSEWNSNELQHYNTPLQVGPTPFDTIFLGSFIDEFIQRTSSVSVFGEATWRITPRLRLAGGLRYTDENKNGSWQRPAIAPFTLWNEVLNPPFPKRPLRFDTSFPDANATLQFDVAPHVMAYASVGQGTKSGGFAESSNVPTGNPAVDALIGNETSKSVELGVKSTILDGTAHLNLALFHVSVPTLQDTSFDGSVFISSNIPVRSRGVDAEFVWRAAPWLTFDNAWTFDESKALLVPSFSPPQSPKWEGHSGVLIETPVPDSQLVLHASGYLRYRSWMHNIHSPVYASAPLTTVDLSLGVGPSDGRWLVELVGTNVTNAVSADFAFPLPDPTLPSSIQGASPGPLREITLRASAKF